MTWVIVSEVPGGNWGVGEAALVIIFVTYLACKLTVFKAGTPAALLICALIVSESWSAGTVAPSQGSGPICLRRDGEAASGVAEHRTVANVKWAFTADYVETCNCNYGCPCNFSGFPTNNECKRWSAITSARAITARCRSMGSIAFMRAPQPNPIHEGHGTATLFITEQASPEQRDALFGLLTGQAGGRRTVCPLFAGTITTWHATQFVPMTFVFRWPSESFCGPQGIWMSRSRLHQSSHRRPQQPQNRAGKRVYLEGGACGQDEGHADFRRGLTFDHSGQNAFHTVVEFHEV